ncbi:TlyA family RNA methyltransferase [Desulfolithobacter sp.]
MVQKTGRSLTGRIRFDELLVARGLAADLDDARRLIGAGQVVIQDGISGLKAGSMIPRDLGLELRERRRFVSRGGEKLESGLEGLGVDVRSFVCADIGCSTGGFTDCLLQRGAARVYAIDVGYGVLDWKLRTDPRVVVLERTNARFLSRQQIPEPLDFVVIDASFISLELLLEPLGNLFGEVVRIMALVKPQFELPRDLVTSGGVIRDPALHSQALDKVLHCAQKLGLSCQGIVASAITGARGNQEFLMYLTADQGTAEDVSSG